LRCRGRERLGGNRQGVECALEGVTILIPRRCCCVLGGVGDPGLWIARFAPLAADFACDQEGVDI
jgi:hypothetical protein